MAHGVHDAADALRGQGQAVQHGRAHPVFLGGGDIQLIGVQPLALAGRQNIRDGGKGFIFLGGPGGCQDPGGFLGKGALVFQLSHCAASFFLAIKRVPTALPSTMS